MTKRRPLLVDAIDPRIRLFGRRIDEIFGGPFRQHWSPEAIHRRWLPIIKQFEYEVLSETLDHLEHSWPRRTNKRQKFPVPQQFLATLQARVAKQRADEVQAKREPSCGMPDHVRAALDHLLEDIPENA